MFTIRPTMDTDIAWIKQVFMSIGQQWQENLSGFIAQENGRRVGLVTYATDSGICTIVSLNALTPGKGIGSALLDKLLEFAKQEGLAKIIIASNNATNIFFLKKGFAPKDDLLEMILV